MVLWNMLVYAAYPPIFIGLKIPPPDISLSISDLTREDKRRSIKASNFSSMMTAQKWMK